MSVSANQLIQAQNASGLVHHPVAALTHLYQNTIAFFERTSGATEGYITDDDDDGANNFAGIVREEVDNSSGDAGDLEVELYTEGDVVLQGSGFGHQDEGELAYASDNFTVTASSSNTTKIGRFRNFISTTKMRVQIDTQQS